MTNATARPKRQRIHIPGELDAKLYAVVAPEAPTPISKRTRKPKPVSDEDIKLKRAIDRAVSVLDRLEARSKEVAREAKALTARRASLDKRYARIEDTIIALMDGASMSFAPGVHRTLTLKPNPVSVVIEDESKLPVEYMRTVPEFQAPDKIAIRQAIEAETVVDGAHLAQTMKLVRK
jgi:hypothetical protein